jgi:hypothetical protein
MERAIVFVLVVSLFTGTALAAPVSPSAPDNGGDAPPVSPPGNSPDSGDGDDAVTSGSSASESTSDATLDSGDDSDSWWSIGWSSLFDAVDFIDDQLGDFTTWVVEGVKGIF